MLCSLAFSFCGTPAKRIFQTPVHQRVLSKKLEDHQFSLLLEASSPADKARLLSAPAPHAASWLLVIPSPGLDLHLDPNELQMVARDRQG